MPFWNIAKSIIIASGLFVAIKTVIVEPEIARLLDENVSPYILNNLNAILTAITLAVFVAALMASTNEQQEKLKLSVEMIQGLFLIVVASYLLSHFDFSNPFPRLPYDGPLPAFTSSPILPPTISPSVPTSPVPDTTFSVSQQQEVRAIVADYLQEHPQTTITPDELWIWLRGQIQEKYGIDLQEIQYCLVGPLVRNSSVGVHKVPENDSRTTFTSMILGDVGLAIAHNGGDMNTSLWWFVHYTNETGGNIEGWIWSGAVEEITLGCTLLKRNVPAYLGAEN